MSKARDLARRPATDTHMGRVTVDNGNGTYAVLLNERLDAGDDTNGAELDEVGTVQPGARFAVGQVVRVAATGVQKQKYAILDPGRVSKGTYLPLYWHCEGYDGRRSYAAEAVQALPQKLLLGEDLTVDEAWKPASWSPIWYDGKSATICSQNKWITVATAATRTFPSGFSPYTDTYVNEGVAYQAAMCWNILGGGEIWVSPTDPDGLVWEGVCLSDDGATMYTLAFQYLPPDEYPDLGYVHLWMRAQATATGAVLWRQKITAAPVLGGAGGTGKLVYDGTNLYAGVVATNGEATVSDWDTSATRYVGAGGVVYEATQYNAGRLMNITVYSVRASDGLLMWERSISDSVSPGTALGGLMMVGTDVALTYCEVVLPESVSVVASMEAGSYVTQESHTTIYYPAMKLWSAPGLLYDWLYTRINVMGGVSAQSFKTEEYDIVQNMVYPPSGYEGDDTGWLYSHLSPALYAASRLGSMAVITQSMDYASPWANDLFPTMEAMTVEQAYPDYWTSGRDEWGGPPYAPVWSPVYHECVVAYKVWMVSNGVVGGVQEFVSSLWGEYPNRRWLVTAGAIFGGDQAGVLCVSENDLVTGVPTATYALLSNGTLGAWKNVPGMSRFLNWMAVGGTAYAWDGTHMRRFR